MSAHIKNIATLLAAGTPAALVVAENLAKLEALVYNLPVDQVLEMARTLMGA